MDRTQLLHTLLEREQQRRDEATLAWREAGRKAELAHEQADSLVTYRGEYRKRWAGQFAISAPMEIVRCYQGFVARLDEAITAQQRNAELADQRLEAAQQKLHHREVKLATVRRLIERRQQAARLLLQRAEQKHADESAQRQTWAAREALAAA